jgi:hypothetical protein
MPKTNASRTPASWTSAISTLAGDTLDPPVLIIAAAREPEMAVSSESPKIGESRGSSNLSILPLAPLTCPSTVIVISVDTPTAPPALSLASQSLLPVRTLAYRA